MYIFQPDRYLLEKQIKKFSHYVKGRVLDVGAGDYSRYRHLFSTDEYLKMDVASSENIDVIGSAEAIPFPDQSFDSVVCTQVLEHVKDPFKAVKEISRILKPGGCALITAPQLNELHEEPNDFWRYTKFGLAELARQGNLEILFCEPRGGFFATIAQSKIRYLIDRFNLHHSSWGQAANKVFKIYGKFMLFLDRREKSQANCKHTLGWCVVLKKL